MKILYLASVQIPSQKASGLAIVRQCEAFVSNGNQVDLFVPKRSENEISLQEAYGVEANFNIHKFPSTSLFWLGKPGLFFLYIYETLQVLWFFAKKKGDYDIIFSRDQYRILPFIFLGLSSKCYTELHTVHKNFFTKIVVSKSKKVVVISDGLKNYYSSFGNRTDILVEPSGVYLEQFNGLPNQEAIRINLSLPINKIIFGYAGKLTTVGESKGVEEIIEAFAHVHRKNVNTFLFLAGVEHYEREAIIKRFENLNLPVNSYGLSELDQSFFAHYLMACDILLMNYPNKEHYAKYMSPTKLFAYLASGLPIISSDLPSIRSIAIDGEVIFVEPNNIERYAEVMLDVVKNLSKLILDQGKRKKLARKFEWKERARKITQLFYD